MPSVVPDTPLLTHADLGAASVPKNCFIRSVPTIVKTPGFKYITPGLEVPHDAKNHCPTTSTALQPLRNKQGAEVIPTVLIFAAADKQRAVRFNKDIHGRHRPTSHTAKVNPICQGYTVNISAEAITISPKKDPASHCH